MQRSERSSGDYHTQHLLVSVIACFMSGRLMDRSPTARMPTVPTCAGTTYQVKPDDDCHKISISQNISTEWLIIDNDLPGFCHDFPTQGGLCLINTCEVYTVAQNDTCTSISRAHNITDAQLRSWNPVSPSRSCEIACVSPNFISPG
jgi:hypothetical protein